MTSERICWCGNAELLAFNEDYGRCGVCETLVLRRMPEERLDRVVSDETDFYGKNYWFGHQEDDLGYANLHVRARRDLTERCLYWLRTLLKYQEPSGASLELGCAHGAFVALLQWSGYEARGIELSPWIVEFARSTFGVRVDVGPVEDLPIPPGSLRLLAAMDVLEHFEAPFATVRHCTTLVEPGGLIMFQTPCYREGKSFEDMAAVDDPFLTQLRPQEHTFLFSRRSVTELFHRLGLPHVQFEPAIFAHYDMCVLASREPIAPRDPAAVERVLTAGASGRLVRALLELDEQQVARQHELAEQNAHVAYLKTMIAELERDREARLAVIERQGGQLGQIATLQADVEALKAQITVAEADRAARLEIIERQGAAMGRLPSIEAENQQLRQRVEQLDRERKRLAALVPRGPKLGNMAGLAEPTDVRQAPADAIRTEVEPLQARLASVEAARVAAVDDSRKKDDRAAALEAALREAQSSHAALAQQVQDLQNSAAYRMLRSLGLVTTIDPARGRTPQD